SCTVTMDAAKTVTATFTLKTYTITATAGSGGSITPSGTVTVNQGASQSFTITANTNYTVGGVVVDGSSVGSVTGYTFTNVTGSHTISASFAAVEDLPLMPDAIDLPKTGQTVSYAPGDDGSIQAGIEWPTARFTDNGDGTVTDNLTGLMWLKDGGCLRRSWNNALRAIADLNSNSGIFNCLEYAAVYNDWHLPDVQELESLINYGVPDSVVWLNTEGFKNMKSSYYWSSTTYQGNTTQALMVSMNDGAEKLGSKNKAYYVLPVRTGTSENSYRLPAAGLNTNDTSGNNGSLQAGNEGSNQRFTDNGDGTVTDNLTELMWLKDGGCLRRSWNSALQTIADFNNNLYKDNCLEYAADYTDWRLPNVKELESMIKYGTSGSAVWLNTEGFAKMKSFPYWSSTTYQSDAKKAWAVDMKKANTVLKKKNNTNYLWPVRGGAVGGN
ncbi:MAG: DUF1566 domain-containing protein, partial [Thermodesulfovibrionales bacterium]